MNVRLISTVLVALIALLGLATVSHQLGWIGSSSGSDGVSTRLATTNRIEGAALCPWREPASDLAALFPGATNARSEVRILSGRRLDLAKRLGRQPEAEENSLHVHDVLREGRSAGLVLVRRVKGEHGAIELVVGVNADGALSGIRIQRTREPEDIAAILASDGVLGIFRGCRTESALPGAEWVAGLPSGAQVSAAAMLEGVRSLLVMLSISETSQIPRSSTPGFVTSEHLH